MWEDYLDSFFVTCGLILSWFIGPLDNIMKLLIAFSVIDYVSGTIAGAITHTLSSNIGFKGIFKKVLIFVLAGIAHLLDSLMLGNTALMRDAVCFFYLSNEGISILENSILCGIPVPDKLKNMLLKIHNHGEENNDEKVSKNTDNQD